jgi:hypothetical protein
MICSWVFGGEGLKVTRSFSPRIEGFARAAKAPRYEGRLNNFP